MMGKCCGAPFPSYLFFNVIVKDVFQTFNNFTNKLVRDLGIYSYQKQEFSKFYESGSLGIKFKKITPLPIYNGIT